MSIAYNNRYRYVAFDLKRTAVVVCFTYLKEIKLIGGLLYIITSYY